MNIDLTTTVISSVSSIVVGLLALFAGRNDASAVSIKELRKAQVSNLLGPIDMRLSFSGCETPVELLKSITEIVEKNYDLTPEIIKNAICDLSSKKHLSRSDFDYLAEIVASLYNWTKKQIGYPYAPQKIVKKYRPAGLNAEKIKMVFLLTLLAISPFPTGLVLSLIFVGITIPTWILRLYMCVFFFVSLGFFASDFIRKYTEG